MTNLLNKKLIIFDFDGTLVDSMGVFADIAAKVMNQAYGTPVTEARRQYIETSGLPFFQQLRQLHPEDVRNRATAELFEKEKAIGYFDQKPYPDAGPTISRLREKGILTAVSSNNFQELVDEFIDRHRLDLDFALGFKTESFCKGAPHFAHLQDETGLEKENMLFVGDSLKDAERAADSNIEFIGKTGLFSENEFKNHFPETTVINRLSDLIEIL